MKHLSLPVVFISLTLGNHYVEYLSMPEEDDDPDFIADDETEVSTFEDPEEIDENELKVIASGKLELARLVKGTAFLAWSLLLHVH